MFAPLAPPRADRAVIEFDAQTGRLLNRAPIRNNAQAKAIKYALKWRNILAIVHLRGREHLQQR